MARWIWIPPDRAKRLIDQIGNWNQLYRAARFACPGKLRHPGQDPFTKKKGLQMLVDGADPDRLRELLEVEIATFEDEMKQSAKIREAASYSPTIGILGADKFPSTSAENLTDSPSLGAGIVAFCRHSSTASATTPSTCLLPASSSTIGRMVMAREMLVDGLLARCWRQSAHHHRNSASRLPGMKRCRWGAAFCRAGCA